MKHIGNHILNYAIATVCGLAFAALLIKVKPLGILWNIVKILLFGIAIVIAPYQWYNMEKSENKPSGSKLMLRRMVYLLLFALFIYDFVFSIQLFMRP